MPPLTRWFIKAAMVYLVLTLCTGVLLAFPTAFWILPRFFHGAPRGDECWSWAVFVLLNIGVCLAAVQSLFVAQWLMFFGRSLEMLGLLTFVIWNWRRVKPSGT